MNKIKYTAAALIHWLLTFYTDSFVFERNGETNEFNYIACKIILLILLFFVWKRIFEHSRDDLQVLKFAGLYLIPLIIVMYFKLPQGFLSNDESLIYEEAVHLKDYTWFSYLTTWYYILSLMLIPFKLAPIFIKVMIQLLVCGYTVKRLAGRFGIKRAFFAYIPFLFYPVLAYTTSAHRIPVYFLLYAFLIFKLYMDRQEGRDTGFKELIWILLLGAVLTQWRTEGIYLIIILPLLLFFAYPFLRSIKRFLIMAALFILAQYLVSVPQNGLIPGRMGDKANNRMAPFYAYTITNMMRNGLDRDRNRESLKKIDRYLDIAAIDRINEDLKDINYEDVLILYYPGYTGVREDVTPEDYNAYTEGCVEIFKNNPDVFFKTRRGAFNYAALPYHLNFAALSGGAKGLVLFAFSIVKALFYNLYIPCILLVIGLIIFLIRRRWFEFFASSGLAGHFVIVFILAPASYFKYYFPIYFTVYLFLTVFAVEAAENRPH